MEIIGIGTDIVECLRIRRMIEQHGELFLQRIYTDREVRWCQARKRSTEHFAGRWAAKEAISKCLGGAWQRGLNWTDFEIRADDRGQSHVLVRGAAKELARQLRIADVLITIAHCRAYATAYALAWRGGEPQFAEADPNDIPF